MTFSTNFKLDPILAKVRRHMKRRETKNAEDRIMAKVRREDRYCRFPMCSCGKMKLTLDVAHTEHRGMGGNRALDRTTPEGLILLCRARHRAHKFALDKKTLRCEPLTERGMRGPVRWLVQSLSIFEDVLSTPGTDVYLVADAGGWWELARETAPHQFEPFTEAQATVLRYLAEMAC